MLHHSLLAPHTSLFLALLFIHSQLTSVGRFHLLRQSRQVRSQGESEERTDARHGSNALADNHWVYYVYYCYDYDNDYDYDKDYYTLLRLRLRLLLTFPPTPLPLPPPPSPPSLRTVFT